MPPRGCLLQMVDLPTTWLTWSCSRSGCRRVVTSGGVCGVDLNPKVLQQEPIRYTMMVVKAILYCTKRHIFFMVAFCVFLFFGSRPLFMD